MFSSAFIREMTSDIHQHKLIIIDRHHRLLTQNEQYCVHNNNTSSKSAQQSCRQHEVAYTRRTNAYNSLPWEYQLH